MARHTLAFLPKPCTAAKRAYSDLSFGLIRLGYAHAPQNTLARLPHIPTQYKANKTQQAATKP